MFERHTEKLRRVIFFARYETSQFGAWSIETEHLLLGLLREDKALIDRFLRAGDSIEAIRREVEGRTVKKDEKVLSSIDLPLSDECKNVLKYAAEESEALSHHQIDTVHLLLGLLREEKCLASEILRNHGFDDSAVRQEFEDKNLKRKAGFVPDEETAIRIAEAVWIPIHGQKKIEEQKPFRAKLENDVWTVRGSLPEGQEGSVVIARISKAHGTIFKVSQQGNS